MRQLFDKTPYEFFTTLPRGEVVRRLKQSTVSIFNPIAQFSSREEFPVAGRVREDSCELLARPPILTHNSFIRVLALRIEDVHGGTRLSGRFRLMLFVRLFMTLWFCVITFMGVGFLREESIRRALSHLAVHSLTVLS